MVDDSLYEGKVEDMLKHIQDGAGFATYDYVLNAKHSPLSQKERVRLMIKLAKAHMLVDDDKVNGNPETIGKIPRNAVMSIQDLEKKYKARTNPKNESINENTSEKNEVEKINKAVGKNEIKFYDTLEHIHNEKGHPKYMIWLSNALKGFGVDMKTDSKIKNQSEAEEALYLLSK